MTIQLIIYKIKKSRHIFKTFSKKTKNQNKKTEACSILLMQKQWVCFTRKQLQIEKLTKQKH